MTTTRLSTFAECVGTFPALADSLDAAGVLRSWAAAEPDLAGARSVADLRDFTAPDADPARAGRVLAALVRLGSIDRPGGGPADQDAVLVAIHLLRPMITTRARRCGPASSDEAMRAIISELALVIQTFPWRTAEPSPARLVLDAWHQAWDGQEADNARFRHKVTTIDRLETLACTRDSVASPAAELIDVLVAAARDGAITAADAHLLWQVAAHGGYGIPHQRATAAVAGPLGVSARTARRRVRDAIGRLADYYTN